jgi:hypothetical protein
MSEPLTIACRFHVRRVGRGRQELQQGAAPSVPAVEPGRVPRVARLLALAHRLEGLVRSGSVANYAEVVRLGHVTRARVSQVLSLLNLAPAIQEQVLFLPRTLRGRDPLILRDLLPIAAALDWRQQRRLWAALAASRGLSGG